jgi:hypothetical protein
MDSPWLPTNPEHIAGSLLDPGLAGVQCTVCRAHVRSWSPRLCEDLKHVGDPGSREFTVYHPKPLQTDAGREIAHHSHSTILLESSNKFGLPAKLPCLEVSRNSDCSLKVAIALSRDRV